MEALEHNASMHHLQNQTEHQDGEGEHQGSGLREGARDRWGAGTEPVQCSRDRAQHSRCGLRVHGGGGVSAEAHLDLLDGVLHQHAVRKADLLLKVVLDLLDEHVLALGAAGIVEGSTAGSTSCTPVNAQLLNQFTRQSGVLLNNRRLNSSGTPCSPSPHLRSLGATAHGACSSAIALRGGSSTPPHAHRPTCCSLGGGCSFIFSRQLLMDLMALPMDTDSGRQATCRAKGHQGAQPAMQGGLGGASRDGLPGQWADSLWKWHTTQAAAAPPGPCSPCSLARLCSHVAFCRGT